MHVSQHHWDPDVSQAKMPNFISAEQIQIHHLLTKTLLSQTQTAPMTRATQPGDGDTADLPDDFQPAIPITRSMTANNAIHRDT